MLPMTAQNHEHQNQDGGVVVELWRSRDGGDSSCAYSTPAMPAKAAEMTNAISLYFVMLNAHGLGGDAVVADGHDGAARSGS